MRPSTGSGRGRHKNAGSPETKAWRKVAKTVDGWVVEPKAKRDRHGVKLLETDPRAEKPKPLRPPPPQPPWLDDESFRLLLELREGLR